MDINPKQIGKINSKEQSPVISNRDETDRDDDDPLSIRDASITFIGIILAIMTIFLPAISVFLERPLLHKSGQIYSEMEKNDGY